MGRILWIHLSRWSAKECKSQIAWSSTQVEETESCIELSFLVSLLTYPSTVVLLLFAVLQSCSCLQCDFTSSAPDATDVSSLYCCGCSSLTSQDDNSKSRRRGKQMRRGGGEEARIILVLLCSPPVFPVSPSCSVSRPSTFFRLFRFFRSSLLPLSSSSISCLVSIASLLALPSLSPLLLSLPSFSLIRLISLSCLTITTSPKIPQNSGKVARRRRRWEREGRGAIVKR